MARTKRIYSDEKEKIEIIVEKENGDELSYKISLLDTENIDNTPAVYRQAYYNVEHGDTLDVIASKFNLSKENLLNINELKNENALPNKLILPINSQRKPSER
nr:LysM peptidoglycan-binding domain-containing protein [Cricetibacter osteomyelitidis]